MVGASAAVVLGGLAFGGHAFAEAAPATTVRVCSDVETSAAYTPGPDTPASPQTLDASSHDAEYLKCQGLTAVPGTSVIVTANTDAKEELHVEVPESSTNDNHYNMLVIDATRSSDGKVTMKPHTVVGPHSFNEVKEGACPVPPKDVDPRGGCPNGIG